ncbi:MAG: T9SS type A sorting domain-containing protein, partial [Candidatus Cloacimonetes bacterium]|nr:T9SS type A sorting domain-containing protein [Candidatus Cloacimonadota bacterium]
YENLQDTGIIEGNNLTIKFNDLNNFPNPFNPTTTIKYSLKVNSKVSLNIYNIKGQKVRTLVSKVLPAGEHSIIWNGRDFNGNRVSSGVYFYKLKAGDYQEVKKMMLVK